MSDVGECYDPAFLLPLFTHLLAPGKRPNYIFCYFILIVFHCHFVPVQILLYFCMPVSAVVSLGMICLYAVVASNHMNEWKKERTNELCIVFRFSTLLLLIVCQKGQPTCKKSQLWRSLWFFFSYRPEGTSPNWFAAHVGGAYQWWPRYQWCLCCVCECACMCSGWSAFAVSPSRLSLKWKEICQVVCGTEVPQRGQGAEPR